MDCIIFFKNALNSKNDIHLIQIKHNVEHIARESINTRDMPCFLPHRFGSFADIDRYFIVSLKVVLRIIQ